VEPSKNKAALAVGVAVAATVTTVALAMAVWPALTRPDPPAEATGNRGLRIRLVEPPRALVARGSPLDVGLSEVAQAMAKGREALFVRTPPVTPPVRAASPLPAPPPARRTPMQVAQADEEEDLAPPEPMDDRWERNRMQDRFEAAQRRRWEQEQQRLRRERDERAAWEQTRRDRARWEDDRERDRYEDRRDENGRYDDRYAPPPPDDDRTPPGW
jgi:hypothetical protein